MPLYSEEIQDIMGRIPGKILKIGLSVIFATVLLLLLGSYSFKYPEVISCPVSLTTINPPQELYARSTGKIALLQVKEHDTVSCGSLVAILQNTAIYENTEILAYYLKQLEQPSGWDSIVRHQQFPENLLLWGYFQSEKYFDAPLVRELFKIHPDTYHLLNRKYGDLLKEEITSINVRRGDYLKCPDYHPVCTLDYFNHAIDLIGRDKHFLITSDDLAWCRENFIGKNFHFADRTAPEENLYLQTLCTNNIISNSSFSWWGAWLNSNTDKQVVAPRIWYGPQAENLNTQDLLPDSWLKI